MQDLPPKYLQSTLWIVALATFCQFFLSYNLWFPLDRTFPIVPLFPFLPLQLGSTLTFVCSGLFLLGLFVAAYLPAYRITALLVSLASAGLLLLEDISRMQAWLYLYLLILLTITMVKDNQKRLLGLQFILVMLYFWTGIQKLNIHFAMDVYPWLAGILPWTRPLEDMTSLGYSIGILEMLLGGLLLFNRSRKVGVVLGILLHSGILLLLIVDRWNSVVYPWNVAMMLLLYVLFWNQQTTFTLPKWPPPLLVFWVGILPAFNLLGVSPDYLAFDMYSGVALEGEIYLNDSDIEQCLPSHTWDELLYHTEYQSALSIDDWAMLDFNAPSVGTPSIYKTISHSICRCAQDSSGLEISRPQRWQDKQVVKDIPFRELLGE